MRYRLLRDAIQDELVVRTGGFVAVLPHLREMSVYCSLREVPEPRKMTHIMFDGSDEKGWIAIELSEEQKELFYEDSL